MKNRYYVYIYLRENQSKTFPEGVVGSVCYVGKGTGDRAYRKHTNVGLPKNKENIIIVKDSLTQEQAYLLEIELIKKYGRINNGSGILRNRTDGGEGGNGIVFTEDVRKKISLIMKNSERAISHRKKLAENLIKKIEVRCIEHDLIFESPFLAGIWAQQNTKYKSKMSQPIRQCCNGTREIAAGLHWEFVDQSIAIVKTSKPRRIIRQFICIETKQIFDTVLDAVEWLETINNNKIRSSAIRGCLKNKTISAYGYRFQYLEYYDETKKLRVRWSKPKKIVNLLCIETGHTFENLYDVVEWLKEQGISNASTTHLRNSLKKNKTNMYKYTWKLILE